MKKAIPLLALTAMVLTGFTLHNQRDQIYLATLKIQKNPATVVLDAGHGGSDPGKIGVNQVREKDINLSITLKCKKILEKQNITVVLTRQDDSGLYSDSDSNKKTADLKKRREIIETAKADLAVSIHQNSYPAPSIFGGQVFYYANSAQGELLAGYLQKSILSCNYANTRSIKANTDYYILKSGSCPVVICECGFLSNPEECAKLNSDAYQEQMAKAIATGILSYLYHCDNSTGQEPYTATTQSK